MKTLYKFSQILLICGWVTLIANADRSITNETVKGLLLFIGFFSGIIGTISFLGVISNKGFWMRLDILDKEIERAKEAERLYDIAEKCLINKVLELEKITKN